MVGFEHSAKTASLLPAVNHSSSKTFKPFRLEKDNIE
jgi:hypothetical protein